MIKRVCLLVLLNLSLGSAIAGSKPELGSSIEPNKVFERITSISNKPAVVACYLAGLITSIVADQYAEREFDDKGGYKVEGEFADVLTSDILYALSQGVGYTAANQWFFADQDLDLKTGATNSLVMAASLFITDKVRKSGVFNFLNRNNRLFKCVPWNVKLDKAMMDSIICLLSVRAINKYIVINDLKSA